MFRICLVMFAFSVAGIVPVTADERASSVQIAQADPAETAFWNSVKDSRDADELRAYLGAYPTGTFAGAAKLKLEKLGIREPVGEAHANEIVSTPTGQATLSMPELASGEKGFVGISVVAPSNAVRKKHRLGSRAGTSVAKVSSYGPAAKADLKKNDIILRVDGRIVASTSAFVAQTKAKKPGSNVSLFLIREGLQKEITFPVGKFAHDTFAAAWYGSIEAMIGLAGLLEEGNVFKKNFAEANRWYRKACESGDGKSCSTIANRYYLGVGGVSKDLVEAARWYRRGADQGYAAAMFHLGRLHDFVEGYPHNYSVAHSWYRKAIAKNGHTGALTNLAVMYLDGKGVEKDDKEYVRLLHKAAKGGQSHALINLGVAYANGSGVEQNHGKALEYWIMAGKMRHADAWRILGSRYLDGFGVKKDRTKAIKYYRRGVSQGSRPSLDKLKELGVSPHDPPVVQKLLAELGYDPGPIDGKIGGKVRQAIRAFQRDNGLKQSGKPSLDLQKKLAAARRKSRQPRSAPISESEHKMQLLEILD